MPSTHDKIRDASTRNTALLSALQSLDSAPSQLYQQLQYIKDLSASHAQLETRLADQQRRVTKELAEHKKYNESTFRRFAHKASGRTDKWTEKAAKEEKEYFDAIQAQKSAEDELAYVKQLLTEAEARRAECEGEARRHDELQRELDALYDSIFKGETPEFPEEDERERAVEETAGRLQGVNQRLEKERCVSELVKKVCGRLLDAKRLLMTAHDMSSMDLWGGSTMAGMMKRNALEQADSCIRQVRLLSGQIKQVDPEVDVQGLGAVDVHIGDIWSDIVFDNVFTDYDMHARIRRAETQIDWALQKGARLTKKRQEKETEIIAEVNRVGAELKEKRVELQWSREEAFRRVTGGEEVGERAMPAVGGEDEAPPAYSRT